jgi:hypothetical protein
MFKWIKKLINKNNALILKSEWIVKDKPKTKPKKKFVKTKRIRYGKWEGNL